MHKKSTDRDFLTTEHIGYTEKKSVSIRVACVFSVLRDQKDMDRQIKRRGLRDSLICDICVIRA